MTQTEVDGAPRPSSETGAGARLRLRPDLIRRKIYLGSRHLWVIKDPVNDAFFFFESDEEAILQVMRTAKTFDQVAAECLPRFAEVGLTRNALAGFVHEAAARGLLEVDGGAASAGPADSVPRLARSRWWHHPLAVKLPGVDPSPLLDVLVPHVRNLVRPAVVVAIACLVVAALLTVLLHLDAFLADFAAATRRIASLGRSTGNSISSTVLWLAIAIMVAKLFHELAHAAACNLQGGRCREMGIILLLGVPCLYCDVSDAWLMPYRRQRILTSAAGMMAEVVLASIAVLIWAFTLPGRLHDLATLVVVVCSVSTIIFNGNPLMRYDGYFILSDLTGTPNLAGRAAAALHRMSRCWLWRQNDAEPSDVDREPSWVIVYGLLSLTYRTLVLSFIAVLVLRYASTVGVLWLALPLVGVLMASLVKRALLPVFRSPTPDRQHCRADEWRERTGFWIRLALTATPFVVLAVIPWPQHLRSFGLVESADAVDVVLPVSGQIVGSVAAGDVVKQGESVFAVSSWEMQSNLARIAGEARELQAEHRAIAIRRMEEPRLSASLPGIETRLQTVEEQRKTLQQNAHRQSLSAPRSGRIFAATPRRPTESERRHDQWSWTGSPLDPCNQGATVRSGTLLCRIGHPTRREVSLLVPQNRVDQVREGQTVLIGLAGYSDRQRSGWVTSVSPEPIREISKALASKGWVALDPTPDRPLRPHGVFYKVAVDLQDTSTATPIPPGTTTWGTIQLDSMSFITRLRRFIADNFRIGL